MSDFIDTKRNKPLETLPCSTCENCIKEKSSPEAILSGLVHVVTIKKYKKIRLNIDLIDSD